MKGFTPAVAAAAALLFVSSTGYASEQPGFSTTIVTDAMQCIGAVAGTAATCASPPTAALCPLVAVGAAAACLPLVEKVTGQDILPDLASGN